MSGGDDRREAKARAPKERFVVKFISAVDIPRSNPYLCAYLSTYSSEIGGEQGQQMRLRRISDIVSTPKRLDCHSAVWNCFRDFRIQPPPDAVLTVEIMHCTSDPTKDDSLLGRAEIPIGRLVDESPVTIPLISQRGDRQKTPRFSVTIARAFIHEQPPTRKVIFLIRHGESKWNEAQSKINITGMFDRDHALTELGVFQAAELNRRWRTRLDRKMRELESMQSLSLSDNEPFSTLATERSVIDAQGEHSEDRASLFKDRALPPLPPPASPSVPSAPNYATTDLLGLEEFLAPPAASSSPQNLPAIGEALEERHSAKLSVDISPPARNSSSLNLPVLARNSSHTELWKMLYQPVDFSEEQEIMQDIETRKSFDEDEDDADGNGCVSDSDSDTENEGIVERLEGPVCSSALSPQTASETAEHQVLQAACSPSSPEIGSYRSNTVELLENFHKSDVKNIKENKAAAIRRRDDYIELFLHADRAYSSPLTRALETALVSLEGHQVLAENGLHLYSIIREVKNIGGLDTVGIETGEGIAKRAKAELAAVVKEKRANELLDLTIHVNDTDQVWWTPMASYESEKEQQERVREFVTFMRYCDAHIPIVVGHSLFFKAFYSKRISKSLMQNRKYLSHNLQKFRLSNASMLAVTVMFGDVSRGCSEATILDADLIFGGGFHGQGKGGHGNRNSLERKASLALTEANLLAQVHSLATGSPQGKGGGGSGYGGASAGGYNDSDSDHPPSSGRDRSGSGAPIFRERSGSSSALASMIGSLHSDFRLKTNALTKGVKKISETLTDTLHDIFEK